MSNASIIKKLWKVENLIMCILIWMCIVSFHASFRRTIIFVNDLPDGLSRNIGTSNRNGSQMAKLNEESKHQNIKLKIEDKKLNDTGKDKGKKQEDKNSAEKKKVSKKLDSSEVIKWFRERPEIEKLATTPKKSEHLKKYLINPQKTTCGDGPIDILIYFHCRPGDFERRESLRKTWAATDIFKDLKTRTIFLLGRAETAKDRKTLATESSKYNDIIQGDFIDSYRNISVKALMMIDWVYNYCLQAQFIVKADDDFFVNPFMLVENVISHISKEKRLVMCHLKMEAKVMTDKGSRWYIPLDQLVNDIHLPRHCSGYVALFTGDLIPELYLSSSEQPFITVDDVYLFGFLLGDVAYVNYIDIQEQLTLNQQVGIEEYKQNKADKHLAVSAWGKETQNLLWKETLKTLTPLAKQLINPKHLKS